MKRRDPFNEINEMGFIYEGKVEKSQKTLRMAECKHGPLWNPPPDINYYATPDQPPIKDDEELLRILSDGDGTDWTAYKLSRLRMGITDDKPKLPISVFRQQTIKRKQDKIKRQIEEERRHQKYLKNEREFRKRIDREIEERRIALSALDKLNKDLQNVRSINQIFTPGFIPFNMEICKSIMEIPEALDENGNKLCSNDVSEPPTEKRSETQPNSSENLGSETEKKP